MSSSSNNNNINIYYYIVSNSYNKNHPIYIDSNNNIDNTQANDSLGPKSSTSVNF